MRKLSDYSLKTMAGLQILLWQFSLLCGACGPKFVSHEFTEITYSNAGQAGDKGEDYAGEGGETETPSQWGQESGGTGSSVAGGMSEGGTWNALSEAGRTEAGGGMAGSVGGASTTGGSSSGTGGSVQEQPSCLAHFETEPCAIICTQAPQSGKACIQLLECMRDKKLPPAQSQLDPCYGTGYEDLTRATAAYHKCCD